MSIWHYFILDMTFKCFLEMSQDDSSPTLAPKPTPQNTLIAEDSLHLTPVKKPYQNAVDKSGMLQLA